MTKSRSIKDSDCKFGGCAWKIVKLTSGGLCCLVRIEMRIGVVFESRLAYELEVRRSQGLLRVERKEERGKSHSRPSSRFSNFSCHAPADRASEFSFGLFLKGTPMFKVGSSDPNSPKGGATDQPNRSLHRRPERCSRRVARVNGMVSIRTRARN